MRKGRPLPILKLRSEARDTLEGGARRPKSAPALAPRARVVAWAQEKTHPGVSTELKLSRPGVGKGRRRLVRPGRDGRLEEPRPGTPAWFAALDLASGRVIGECHRRPRGVEFRKFLGRVEEAVPAPLDVPLILDHYGTHKTPLIRGWLARHPRYHLHFTPTSASSLVRDP